MFFRYDGNRRKAIDLDNTFGGPCFLLGGSPQLNDVKDLFANKPVMKIAMNNTATIIRPDIWIGADIAENYSASVLIDPGPMKFTYITRRKSTVGDKIWQDMPNTYFMSSRKLKSSEFFLRNRDFVWDKNVFTLAIQLAYRLGFNEAYLVGCSFKIAKNNLYCYERELNEGQIRYNQKTYNRGVDLTKQLLPYAEKFGFKIISCTPDSKINKYIEYCDLSEAIAKASSIIPPHNTKDCRHPKND